VNNILGLIIVFMFSVTYIHGTQNCKLNITVAPSKQIFLTPEVHTMIDFNKWMPAVVV